ncbi:MAG: hypothetical protein C5B56_04550, partial [Proteobacteria bacterium]
AERLARVAADQSRVRESQQRVVAEDNSRKAGDSERTTQRLLYAADMRLAHAAWEEGNLARMTSLLDAHRPKPGEPDARGFEYYYLQNLAKGEQEQILVSHTNAVLNVALSPDGKWLASRGLTDTRLWDLGRRMVVAVWPSPHGVLGELERTSYGLSFSRDSKYLAIASEQGLSLCELSTRQTRLLQGEAVERPLFSPVTNLIAFTGKAGIHVWDYMTNQEVGLFGPRRRAWCWSPDGARLLAGQSPGSAGFVEWFDATTFKSIETDRIGSYISGTAVSRDGRLTAAADWLGELWLLENPGGKVLARLDCGDIRSSALAFSPDGKFLASASRDQAILIWDVASRQRVRQLRGHHAKVTSLAYTADGQTLFSGDTDGKVLVWDMSSEIHHLQIANRLASFGVGPPQFSADGKLLAVANTDEVWSILDASTLQPQLSVEGEFVAFSPDSRQVAYAARHGRQQVLQVSYFGAASPRASIPFLWTEDFSLLRLSPDGKYLVNTLGTGAILFDASNGERLMSLTHPEMDFSQKVLLPDGHTLVAAAGSALDFWDASSRQKTRTLDCGGTPVSLAVSPDGRFLAASRRDLKILLWDLRAGGDPDIFAGHQAMVWALAFSADGRTLASGGEDRCLKLWDLTARREIASFLQDRPVYWLAFAPNNETLVWGGIGSYQVWRAPRDGLPMSGTGVATSSGDLPVTSLWRVQDGMAPGSPRVVAEKNQCFTNLLRIHAALMSYQKDHQQMPDWLSDLVPKYLSDTNLLLCPVQAETGISSSWLPIEDPKITSSYSYEFSGRPVSFSDRYGLAISGDTMKTWKTKQLRRYGPVVPVLRCSLHGMVLNVTYGGERWESPSLWESVADVQWRARDHAGAEQWYREMEQEGETDNLNALAWNWATAASPEARDGPAAVRFAQKAVELTNRKEPEVLDTLSTAYAETEQFDKAVSAELEAISSLKSSPPAPGTEAKLKDFESRLELYQHKRPYRQEE